MTRHNDLSAERLRELFHYNSDTGEFTRLITTAPNAMSGSVAGSLDDQGYLKIYIDGVRYRSHRLAWLYVYGRWPVLIDHINRNRSDNRISNLREAIGNGNQCNSSISKSSSSGVKGVSWVKSRQNWQVRVKADGRDHYGGRYSRLEDAEKAAISLRQRLHGEFSSDAAQEPRPNGQ